METTHDDTLEISQGAKANPQETDSLVCLWATKCAAYALEARDFALHNTVMRGLRNIGEVYALNKFFKESVLECLRMVSYGDYACLGNEAANVTVVDPQVLALLAAAAALVDLGWSAKDSIDYVLAEY
jgi:hypothetical protein